LPHAASTTGIHVQSTLQPPTAAFSTAWTSSASSSSAALGC
jgi:hypothetical protein